MQEEILETGEGGKDRFLGEEEVSGKRPSRIRGIFINRKLFHGGIFKRGRGLPWWHSG